MLPNAKDFTEIKASPHYKFLDEVCKIKDKSYLDESFISKERWALQNKKEYLESVLQNMCLTPFIIVDVAACLKAAKDNHRVNDIEYYESILRKNKEYITCDSNNRQTTLLEGVLQNKITLPTGTYSVNGRAIKIDKNTYFSDLSTSDQHQILQNRRIIVVVINEATREELAKIFDSVNKGVTQNAQEIRNSWYSNLGQPIRDLSAKLDNKFIKAGIVSQTESNRRKIDEYLVDICQYEKVGFQSKFSKPSRDSWYTPTSSLIQSVKKVETVFDQMDIPKIEVNDKGKKFSVATERAVFMNAFMRLWLSKNNYKIKDSKEFDSWVYKKDKEWLNIAPTLSDGSLNPDCPHFINDEGITYPYKSAGRRSRDFMEWNFDLFMKTLIETKNDLIVSLDSQRLATPTQKYHIWVKQDGKTPSGDTEIPLSELLDYTKWQADHIVRYTDGGPTTLDNLQLISAEENLKKANQTTSTEIL